MSKKSVLVYERLTDDQLAALSQDFEVTLFSGTDLANDPAFREALKDAHGLVGVGLSITPKLLDAAPKLEAIASISVGVDNYLIDELTRRGILLCNTPDVLTETTADTGLLLIMATARRAVDNITLALRGERPISLVNEDAWSNR